MESNVSLPDALEGMEMSFENPATFSGEHAARVASVSVRGLVCVHVPRVMHAVQAGLAGNCQAHSQVLSFNAHMNNLPRVFLPATGKDVPCIKGKQTWAGEPRRRLTAPHSRSRCCCCHCTASSARDERKAALKRPCPLSAHC